MTTSRTAVVAEVPDVRGRVVVGGAAADAVLRVGGVLQRRAREARIVDAEAQRLLAAVRELGDEGIVGVDDERRGGRGAPRSLPASARRCARARRSGRAGRERGCRARRREGERGASARAARTRRPRAGRDRHPAPREASRRSRRRGSRPSCSRRAGSASRGSARASRWSSSCRSSPRRRRRRPAAALRACRQRPGSTFQRSFPGKRRATAAAGGPRQAPDQAGGGCLDRQAGSHAPRAYPAAVARPGSPRSGPTCTSHKMI